MANVGFGININPRHEKSRPEDASDLAGLSWVRFVFMCAAAEDPDLATSFGFYDPFVDEYNDKGVGCLLILNQETVWGHGPWHHGNWPGYADDFAREAGRIAAHYRGKNVAYQIWNEGDTHGESSIFVEPQDFAKVLARSSAAIKAEDPNAKVVLGGMASGTETAIRYVKDVRNELQGNLPVDVIAVHPYGHWPPSGPPPIPTGWFAPLESALGRYTDEFAPIPIWITEIGVSEPNGIGAAHWSKVADYMAETLNLIRDRYAALVPAVIWFAWSDVMRGAGILDIDGNPKTHIYDRFFEVVRAAVAEVSSPVIPPQTDLTPTKNLAVREGGAMGYDVVGSVGPGDRLVVEESWETAWAKLGRTGEWIHLRTPDHLIGWSEAPFLKLALNVPEEAPALLTPSDTGLRVREGPGLGFTILDHVNPGDLLSISESWPGAIAKLGHRGKWIKLKTPEEVEGWTAAWILRLPTAAELAAVIGAPPPLQPTGFSDEEVRAALAFDREPSFDRLPVCDPAKILSFSGFGPNNYSYRVFANGSNYYASLRGLHNGLDFGLNEKTALCAIDWGVVVHASLRDNHNPYAAGPYSVIVRHGRYVVVYGHIVGKVFGEHIFVREGDLVAPGQSIGLSGTSNFFSHLHFEMRKIRQAYINELRREAELVSDDPLEQLRHMQSKFNLRGWLPTTDYYVNPAPFFAPRLETYWATHGWAHACHVPQDSNDNGYPDQVILKDEDQPTDFGLYSIAAYGPTRPQFWEESHVA